MIDFETVCFIRKMDELAELSANGILPFSKCTATNRYNYIFYNDKTMEVVCDCMIDEHHHNIISVYDKRFLGGADMHVLIDDGGKPFVDVICNDMYEIVIEDGRWYFA